MLRADRPLEGACGRRRARSGSTGSTSSLLTTPRRRSSSMTSTRRVNGDTVQMSLTAPGYGGGWLAFYVPGGLHLDFPTSETIHTLGAEHAMGDAERAESRQLPVLGGRQRQHDNPVWLPRPRAGGRGRLHALARPRSPPSCRTPPTTSAWLDPINGLWKVTKPDGSEGISYPTAFKAKMVANNTDGVSTLEGTFSPAGVIGVNTGKYTPPGNPPAVRDRRARQARASSGSSPRACGTSTACS